MRTMMKQAASLVESDRATIFVLDHVSEELWSKTLGGELEIRFPMLQGLGKNNKIVETRYLRISLCFLITL